MHFNLVVTMKNGYGLLVLLLGIGLAFPSVVQAQKATVIKSTRSDMSPNLRDIDASNTLLKKKPAPFINVERHVFSRSKKRKNPSISRMIGPDPTRQFIQGTLQPGILENFEGSGQLDNAEFNVRFLPPDVDGDVGPNHYVQWINKVFQVFDKSGNTLMGPVPGDALFEGFGGMCEENNNGDPIVFYDERADRWNISQFVTNDDPENPQFGQCIAVSTTPDPTGTYYRYEIDWGQQFVDDEGNPVTVFADYPKLGVWGDSYTMTTRGNRIFGTDDFTDDSLGEMAFAMDRSGMLAGNPEIRMVMFEMATGSIPADADTDMRGPAIFGGHGSDNDAIFELYALDVDWANPAAARFRELPGIEVTPFNLAELESVDQPTGHKLDNIRDVTQQRLNARDFGTHMSMVVNHTIETDPGVNGIRWYEFRNTRRGWELYQEGTFSPDNADRWNGSMAINEAGDIALGYSISSETKFPSIYMTGQTADESGSGMMNVAETVIVEGTGAQGDGSIRWGDYSDMGVDPVDDSFWYTGQYYGEEIEFETPDFRIDFRTRVAQFVLESDEVIADNAVTSYILVDADTDQDLFELTDGITLDLLTLPPNLNVRAEVTNGVESVHLSLSPQGVSREENVAPYSLFGDANSDYDAGTLEVGMQTLSATPYSGDNQSGEEGTSLSIKLNVVEGGGPGFAVTSFTLIDADEDEDLFELTDGITLDLSDLPANLAVRANVTDDVESVVLSLNPQGVSREENVPPYSLFGDETETGDYYGGAINPGEQTLSAIPYSEDLMGGETGTSLSITLNVVNGASAASFAKAGPAMTISSGTTIASADVPTEFELGYAYPNPFNPVSLINFDVPEAAHVSINVYNMLGQQVAVLANEFRDAGTHTVRFDAQGLSAGVYIYTMQSGEFHATRQMTLLK